MTSKSFFQFVQENNQALLQERVKVNQSRYERAHGKKAKGSGNWMFTTKAIGTPKSDETASARGTLAAAAAEAAEKLGATEVYVMESTIEEAAIERFASVKIKSKGVTGTVTKIAGNKVTVRTDKGSVTVDKGDLEVTE